MEEMEIPAVEAEATNVATDEVLDTRKSQAEIVKELIAKGARKYRPVKVKNVTVKENEQGWLNAYITIDGRIPAYVLNPDTGEYTRGTTNVIFTSIDKLIGNIKEDGTYLDKISVIQDNPNYVAKFFGGGTITILAEEVPANTLWKNPFAVRDYNADMKDFDRIVHHIVGFDPNANIKKAYLISELAGSMSTDALAKLIAKMQ